ncbi:MAG: aminotransferase class I/II-fold pyridoxal phosphate-dependent enzyme [bacterium]|nr:aminotransferase class I/II-fold pyridoxal phosphate-dependent enzyme [bacterium]
MHIKPISISLSPNVEKDDIKFAKKAILRPWKWKRGRNAGLLEQRFKEYLGARHAFSFNSGRSSLYAILKALNLQREEEVLIQAFTCNAVPNPIIWLGLKPVYVDCNENNFNIDLDDLKKKATNKSKVLIVQHTFGFPAEIDKLVDFANQNNLILIEDCAHSLGAEYDGKKIGTFGKAAFFSFSRDKIISSVYGGMAVTDDPEIAEKIRKIHDSFSYPGFCWIFQQLLHPLLLNYIILPIYNLVDLGKIFLVLSQWLHILSKAVHWKEKRGERPDYFPKKLPNALALLALNQFNKLNKFYNHRRKIVNTYLSNFENTAFSFPEISEKAKPSFLRLPVKHAKAHEIIWEAWNKENILIGDWYTSPVAPCDTKLDKMQYVLGSCPKAEKLSEITFNLPTHINISEKDLQRIINFLNKYKS